MGSLTSAKMGELVLTIPPLRYPHPPIPSTLTTPERPQRPPPLWYLHPPLPLRYSGARAARASRVDQEFILLLRYPHPYPLPYAGTASPAPPLFDISTLPFRYSGARAARAARLPIHNMFSLVRVCARTKHPFITSARLHYPHYCNTYARRLCNI